MNIAHRKQLAETSRTLIFEGVPCKIAGWANEYATVTADFPSFYYGSASLAHRKPTVEEIEF